MNDGIDIGEFGENQTIKRQKQIRSAKSNFDYTEEFARSNRLSLDITYITNQSPSGVFISKDELDNIAPLVVEKYRQLLNGEGDCKDGNIPMLGWITLPDEISEYHIAEILEAAESFRKKIDVFISLGIGGSYLGIEATFRALTHTYFNQLSRADKGDIPEIYFLGQNLDPDFFRDSLDNIKGKRIGINVISKSGTTTETTIAFRLLRNLIEKWAKDKAADFIVATTDKSRGALRTLANQKKYRTYIVPDNIGGRFSVLSDVGLFGLAVAGINIAELVAGFRQMKARLATLEFWRNPAMVHAAVRHLAFQKGKRIEVVASNSTHLYQLARWMEQLFPESEGHDGHGLWVSPTLYSEKLHANGQMIQEGVRNILETFLRLENHDNSVPIPPDSENLDGFNFLSDRHADMNLINKFIIDSPAYAHFQGGVPNMAINIPKRNAFNIGQLYYLMEVSVAISGYLAGHNPFIQPGVEAYKKAMFALAGKPGSEKDGQLIKQALSKLDRLIID
jgi:glucose-6-phosphate isomerase